MTDTTAFERLKDMSKLPSPSGVALSVLKLSQDESTTVEEIAKAVEADPAISSRLLKLVNSSFAGLPRKVGSLDRAVAYLGLRTVTHLALGFSLIAKNRKGACRAFDYEFFWSESLAMAVSARHLVVRKECMAPDEGFTLGLLSQLGRLALASAYPEEYAKLLADSPRAGRKELAEKERECFGIDHCALAAEMMADWHMPELFCKATRAQLAPWDSNGMQDARVRSLAGILNLAGAIALILPPAEVCREALAELTDSHGRLGLAADEFTPAFDSISKEWREAGKIFSIGTREVPNLEDIYHQAEESRVVRGGPSVECSRNVPLETQVVSQAGSARVLAVDDDPTSLKVLVSFLTSAGYEVLSATNGEEAMRVLLSEGPQLVVTDCKMPKMGGLELCRRIRAQEGIPFAYVIIVTAESDGDGIVKAFEAGADDYLTKPFKRKEILARVRGGIRIIQLNYDLERKKLEAHRSNAEMAIAHGELSAANEKLHRMATTDELTGLTNRREAMKRLKEDWALADRHGQPLSCIMLDIDHFKRCNDVHGHAAGDRVLKETARVLGATARLEERVCRIGGEEFLVICPNTTEETARIAAERLRGAVDSNVIDTGSDQISVTISLGVAERSARTATPDDLLGSADYALYAAKHRGRNRVCLASRCDPKTEPREDPRGPSAGAGTLTAVGVEPTGPATVLLVDDDADVRTFCRRVLEREGHTVIEAADGLDALKRIGAGVPDVAIIDSGMPDMNGLECTRRLKNDLRTRGMSIILASARKDRADITAGLEAGADEYLTKPLEPKELALRVRTMVRLRRDLTASNEVRGEQTRALALLLEFSHKITSTEALSDVLDGIIAVTSELTCSYRVSVMLPDAERRALAIVKSIGIDDETTTKLRVETGTGISGTVFESGTELVLNSTDNVAEHGNSDESSIFQCTPLVSTPLCIAEHVVGVLNIADRQARRPFTPLELEYIDFIANISASAIDEHLTRKARDEAHESIVIALATLAEHRDPDTGKHLDRVSRFCTLLAQDLRSLDVYRPVITDRFLEDLFRAVPLHDIGKVAVPDYILLKPDKLTAEETTIMRTHAEIGARTIRSVIKRSPGAQFLHMAEQIAMGHHEWYNGEGYPCRVRGEDIPLPARITAVADVYDALTTKRPYKEPMSHAQAARIIFSSSGRQFDPVIVRAFAHQEQQFRRLARELADDPRTAAILDQPDPGPHREQAPAAVT